MKKLLKCYFVFSLVILMSCNSDSSNDPIDQNSSSSVTNSQSTIETPKKEYTSLSGYFSLYPGVEGGGMYLYFYPNGNAEIWSCIQTDCNLGKVKYRISNNTVFINTLGKEVSMWVDEDFKIEGDQLLGSKGDNYIYNGETIDYMPFDILSVTATPVYKEIDGWKEDLTQIHEINEIPEKLMAYIKYLEKELGVPVKYLSVGPDRKQTLVLS